MPTLPSLTGKQLVAALRSLGSWELRRELADVQVGTRAGRFLRGFQ
jgi:hypothetical protein